MAALASRDAHDIVMLLLAGDVMTGRGIDQILAHPCDPVLHEQYVRSATGYVDLAEKAHGPIPRPVPPHYIWGDAIVEIERRRPDLMLVNLETSITARGVAEPKGINYRMHPDNIEALRAAGIGAVSLANNHVMDWGVTGLRDTLEALDRAGIGFAGAGRNAEEAARPVAIPSPGPGRVIVFAAGTADSGIPARWQAGPSSPGVHVLADLSSGSAREIGDRVAMVKRPGDIVVVSIHWGANWGHAIPDEHATFARLLIDEAAVDVVHGHSSHHPKALEVHSNKLVLYGCGDLINDYEGIGGYSAFRPELALLYFARIHMTDGTLAGLEMVPLRVQGFRLQRAGAADAAWLAASLSRQSRGLSTRIVCGPDNVLVLAGE